MFLILTEPLHNMKECVVNVTYGDNCNILLGIYEASDKGDKLETPPLGFIEDVDHYCYSVTTKKSEKKVIHRDLCGDNILIREEDIPIAKITDFGMSRIFDMEAMTHSISVLGHRNGYLPPEGPYHPQTMI